MGRTDIDGPIALVTCLNMRATAGDAAYLVHIKGEKNDTVKPIETRQSKSAGWQHSSLRKYTYTPEGTPVSIELYSQSGLNDSPAATVNVPELWPPDTLQEKIIPEAQVSRAHGATIPPVIRVWKTPVQRRAEEEQRQRSRTPLLQQSPATNATDTTSTVGRLKCTVTGCCRVFINEHTRQRHMDSGKHQSQGSATSSSWNRVEPTPHTSMSVRDMSIDFMKQITSGMGANTATVPGLPVRVSEAGAGFDTEFTFGWATRTTLRHPPLSERFQQFMHWAWHQGEIGPYKYTASALLELVVFLGTDQMMHQFGNDPLWIAALAEKGGSPIFRPIDLPEEWRVKQYYSGISAKKKAASKAEAMTQTLTTDQLREQLLHFLPLQPDLLGVDYNMLVKDLVEGIGLGSVLPLHVIIQKHLLDLLDHGSPLNVKPVFTRLKKRAIVHVITKQVGQQPMPPLNLDAVEMDRVGFDNNDDELHDCVDNNVLGGDDDSDDDDDEGNNKNDDADDDGLAEEGKQGDDEEADDSEVEDL
jgi:hypothetical protein